MARAGPPMRRRWREGLVIAAVLFAGIHPMIWSDGTDDFPLTPYPMFSGTRPDAVVELVVALGDEGSAEVPLPSEATGHRHLTQAVKALSTAVAAGNDEPRRLCEVMAIWAGDNLPDVRSIRIVTAAYDGVAYLTAGATDPAIIDEHAWCEVQS